LEVGVWKLEFGIWNWLLRISHCELNVPNDDRLLCATLRPLCLCGKKSLRLRSDATTRNIKFLFHASTHKYLFVLE
jgi:hypothetical protein